jgi:hypothetical protein
MVPPTIMMPLMVASLLLAVVLVLIGVTIGNSFWTIVVAGSSTRFVPFSLTLPLVVS